ncbi:MAG: rRNA pseudouridine synthase [Acidobacteria bacterium]|nr:rRNA pseudouridine synthase [Acidobacteriota bacterium]
MTGTIPDHASGVRLQKYLADSGVASRREGERLIGAGRVEVNGKVVMAQGLRVDPDRDVVRVDGRRVQSSGRRVYYLLHKPKGFITSASDPEGRPTVLELLQGVRERIFPVGRLDWNSEGLLIFTNDGDLTHRLTHPANHVPKVYRVKVKGAVTGSDLEALRRGMFLEGRRTLPARVERVSGQANTWLEVTLHEGRRNQIRRMFDRLGHRVQKLKRIAIGPIRDRALKPGEWRRLTPDEIRRLREAS